METTLRSGRPLAMVLCRRISRPKFVFPTGQMNSPRLLHTTSLISQQDRNGTSTGKADESTKSALKADAGAAVSYAHPSIFEKIQLNMAKRTGPFSPIARDIQGRLQASDIEPLVALNQYISEDRVTAEIVRICLISAKAKLNKIPRKFRATHAKKSQVSIRPILVHIWGDPKLWVPVVCVDAQAQEALCYLAILEGLGDYILDWIRANVEPGLEGHDIPYYNINPKKKDNWRSSLLRHLIIAHMNVESGRRADSALNCFFDAVESRQQLIVEHKATPTREKTGFMSASVVPARHSLDGMINAGCFYNTDPVLYDRYVRYCDRQFATFLSRSPEDTRRVMSGRISAADLRLHHPTLPNADWAMDLFRDLDTNEGLPQPRLPVAVAIRRMMEQAHILTTVQSKAEDAAWLAKKHHEVFGESVKVHEHYKSRFSTGYKSFRPSST